MHIFLICYESQTHYACVCMTVLVTNTHTHKHTENAILVNMCACVRLTLSVFCSILLSMCVCECLSLSLPFIERHHAFNARDCIGVCKRAARCERLCAPATSPVCTQAQKLTQAALHIAIV